MATEQDQRAQLLPDHVEALERRATPTLFIIDKRLRVLYYRADPSERRKEFRPTDGGTLPPSLEYTILKLLAQGEDPVDGVWRAAASASVALRIIELAGGAQTYAVLVERFALRDQMETIATRYGLSPRERQVLNLVVKGLRNEEIAQHLFISKSTAIFHVKQLLTKTSSRNRTEMVAKIIASARQRPEDVLRMPRHADFRPHLDHRSGFIDQKRRALRHAKGLAQLSIDVGEQRERNVVFLFELLMRRNRVAADADDFGISASEPVVGVAELRRFTGSTRRIVLGIEPQHQVAPAKIIEAHRLAGVVEGAHRRDDLSFSQHARSFQSRSVWPVSPAHKASSLPAE